MGIFGKLKENFTHGGVKIQLQAPASVSMQDASLAVTVLLSSSEEQHTVTNVRVQIVAETRNEAFSTSNTTASAQAQQHVVALSEYNQPFTILPGETKSLPLNVIMNQGAAIEQQLPEGSGMAQVAGMLQKLQSVSEAMNGASYTYFIEASAHIEGIAFGASYQQPIQVLKPGQTGTAFQGRIGI